MPRPNLSFILGAAIVVGAACPTPSLAQSVPDPADLSGGWTLNRSLSQFPREVGFNAEWAANATPVDNSAPGGGGGGRGRRATGGVANPFSAPVESADDAKRLEQLTAEVRNPSVHLTIAATPSVVTIADDAGRFRTFHSTGREEEIELDGVPVPTSSKREGSQLVVLYNVEKDRQIRYTYSRVASPPQLTVDVQFLDHGKGDVVKRVYEPRKANEPVTTSASAAPTKPLAAESSAPASTPTSVPASGQAAAQPFNQQPDAELKGLTNLGVVVEDLSSQSTACGLSQGALEATVTKHLTDAGFRVRRNSDEDTYVYVNINTTSLSSLCVSRYDVFVYTHTTAKLSYQPQDTPVLVEVSLLHKGGLAGGAAAPHAESVVRGVEALVDQFATRIKSANK